MNALITDHDLAKQFGIELGQLHRLRREKKWPCVKFSRTDFRFTAEQVEQIIAMQTVANAPRSTGQTSRSARRSA
jgi:hypothetical protein